MTRLLAGAGTSAVLLLAGAAACGGPDGSVAAHPAKLARSAPHSRVSADAGTVRGRFVIFGTMGRVHGGCRADRIFGIGLNSNSY